MSEHILVVDDEADILELVDYNLTREGFDVSRASTGEDAIEKASVIRPDLIVLDLMLPGLDGLEVCKRLKGDEATRLIPIVMLTAKDEASDIVRGLEMGADDYVTKPFSPSVLLARVRAVLRRLKSQLPGEGDVIEVHGMTIHPGRHEVLVGDDAVSLTNGEFRALHFLSRRPGWVFTRHQIVRAVHGEEYVVTDRAIDVMMVGLRRKLGDHGSCIETVRGVGYRLKG